jgi:hypothetical protein
MTESRYDIDITMSDATALALEQGKYRLYGFKGVQSSTPNGSPVVWLNTDTYSTETTITWERHFAAYGSTTAINPGYEVTGRNSKPIKLGEKFTIISDLGIGEVSTGGQAGLVSVINTRTKQFTVGVSQAQPGQPAAPLCAVTLHGLNSATFIPVERVLLTFATQPFRVGTVIVQMFAPGLLIDMGTEQRRSVTFDINQGWAASGNPPWAANVDSGDLIAPLLMQYSMQLAAQVEEVKILP